MIAARPPGYLNSSRPTPAAILWAVSEVTGIDPRSITDHARYPWLVEARWLLAWVAHRRFGYPKLQIARFTGFHHTTVMHGIRKADRRIEVFRPWANEVERLLTRPLAIAA